MMENRESEHAKARTLSTPKVVSIIEVSKNSVTNQNGENLGKVEDIMVDIDCSRIAFAVISSGGLFSRETRLYAVPWDAFSVSLHDKRFILNVTKETMSNAPSFSKNNFPDLTSLTWLKEIYRYYGYEPYWEESPSMSVPPPASAQEVSPSGTMETKQ